MRICHQQSNFGTSIPILCRMLTTKIVFRHEVIISKFTCLHTVFLVKAHIYLFKLLMLLSSDLEVLSNDSTIEVLERCWNLFIIRCELYLLSAISYRIGRQIEVWTIF